MDRVVGGPRASVSGAMDEWVADTDVFWHFTEERGHTDFVTEASPVSEVGRFGPSVLSGGGSAGASKSNAEISEEAVSGRSVCSTQGFSCGQHLSKWARKRESVRCCRREASSAMTLALPGRWAPWWQ